METPRNPRTLERRAHCRAQARQIDRQSQHRSRLPWVASAVALLLVACSNASSDDANSVTVTALPAGTVPLTSISVEPSSTSSEPVAGTSSSGELTLVALGDSVPFNSSNDCSGCVGYVDQYKDAIATATGKAVTVVNLSSHAGLTSTGLSADLANDASLRASVAAADAITISIGFNDAPMLVDDDPCDGAVGDTQLGTYTDACISQWADAFAERYTTILDEIKTLRGDKPTLLTVINIFDTWLGFSGNPADFNAHIGVVKTLLESQNAAICRVAADHGALCADLHSAFNGANHDQPSGALLGPDYSHPSQAGNDLIAKTLENLGFAPLA